MSQFLLPLSFLAHRFDFYAHSGRTALLARLLAALTCVMVLFSLVGCESENDSVLDQNASPPKLLFASTTPSVVNSDTMNTGPVRTSQDTLTLKLTLLARLGSSQGQDVASVRYHIVPPGAESAIAEGLLLDDGVGSDATKNDQLYSGLVSFRIQRSDVGIFNILVTAFGSNDFSSNTVIIPLTVLRGNHPPAVSLVAAPDSVQLQNQSQLLTLRIRSTDPDGLSDIVRVYFNSFRPDGTPSGGNPFQMFDDGLISHGDEKASDGVFSLVVTLPPSTQVGTYRFEFRAIDRSDEQSNTIIHRVTVKQ